MLFVRKSLRPLLVREETTHTVDELVRFIDQTFLNSHESSTYIVTGFLPKAFKTAPVSVQVDNISLNKVEAVEWVRKYQKIDAVRFDMEQSTRGTRWGDDFDFFDTTAYQYEMVVPSFRKMVGSLIGELCEPLDKLRAVLNFIAAYGIGPGLFSNQQLIPQSPILPSPLFFVEDRERSRVQFLFNPLTLTVGSTLHQVKDHVWEQASEILGRLQRPSSSDSILPLLWKLLDIHQQALDSTDEAVAFLHYWQVVERTVSPIQNNRGFEIKNIVSRLGTLVDLASSDKDMLQHLGGVRNEFAHIGKYPYGSDRMPVRAIKPFADACISSLIYKWSKKLPTNHDLDAYLDMAGLPIVKRNAIHVALSLLSEDKGSSS
jgi:hypothetical protein